MWIRWKSKSGDLINMAAIEVGRICFKTKGREAGKTVVIVEKMNDNFVAVEGDGIKKGKCNVLHLFPTKEKISITKSSNHDEIIKLLKEVKFN